MNAKLCVIPSFNGPDRGDGGIRRVVEAQRALLPGLGFDIVESQLDADIVATHASLVAAQLPATTPLVCHTHGLYWYGYEWERWALKMNRDVIRAMRQADVVTAPSEFVAQAIRRGSQIDPVVLHHGINVDDWAPAPGARAQAGGSGGYVLWNKTRIDPICDPRPVHKLARLAPNRHFITTVAWPHEPLPVNMSVAGVTSFADGKSLIEGAAVYLCTTRETFGIGTIEAMACGIPVLGWDWGGQREIVTHKVNGWLAPEGDYESLALGLEWCFSNRAAAGDDARHTVLERFTWPIAMQRYADLYRSMLEPHAGPTVSVVIPAYNMDSYLHSAVGSVLEQRYDDVEIIIVDDASTDETGAIADSLAQVARATNSPVKIEVIHNPKNLYLAEALNAGIEHSHGRYIVPLDADNLLGNGVLGLLAEALDKDRDFDIAYGAMSVIEADGSRDEWVSDWPQQFDYRRQMKHQNQIPSTSMYRRRAWERVGGYRRRCRTAEDADFWCRTTSFGADARKVTDAVVLRYRNRSDSMSHVVADWPWHEWYPWGKDPTLTPWIAPIPEAQREDPVIPPYEMPLVSVVIPVGPGHARLVLDALDSLNAQTFRWWEAIVVNDTGAPLPWVPAWCKVVDTGGRVGAGAARNRGMAVSGGRFFTFLDADDYFQPRALELMVDTWTRTKGFVYTDWFVQETGEPHFAPDWDGCESVLRQLPWPVTCLYPIDAWVASGGFDENLSAWEDWDFALRIVRAGYCGTRVPAPLFHYRMDAGRRREAGFADRESLKAQILERWSDYITGGKEMPCGCAGGGGLPSLPALDLSSGHSSGIVSVSPSIEGVTSDQMVLLEFTEPVPAPLTFTGKVTGTRYRFGSDDDNRVRYVYRTDAESLLTNGSFRPYNEIGMDEPLLAAGPPR